MHTSLFDYHLPPELIAQEPMRPRDHSRLLVLHRESGRIEHRYFCDIGEYLRPGDILVINDTKVFRARLRGIRVDNGAPVDILLLREVDDRRWEALVKPGRRAVPGCLLAFPSRDDKGREGATIKLRCHVVGRTDYGGRVLDFRHNSLSSPQALWEKFKEVGEVPIPPYIKSPVTDDDMYQTVYAKNVGSVAAPTAGFHFTEALMEQLRAAGVLIARITLHIGIGTFRPIKTEHTEQHEMHEEYYCISPETTHGITEARRQGGRVIAVGTTCVRALESSAAEDGSLTPQAGWTALFITLGYRFRVVDALITNFHLPRSTLLVLVCAFAGRDRIMQAYREAIKRKYRFYSFGDAMLIC